MTWFEKNVYNKVNLDNETLKLYFRNKIIKPSKRVCRVIHDSNDYLYKTFFKKNELCYGLIVINENGEFITFTGEYTHKTINIFIEDLKIQKQ